jgi:hypothetical protein
MLLVYEIWLLWTEQSQHCLTRPIAANIAKLPELLRKS